ncbi:hypothetical protein [Nocardia transvalensis]|uniref:hypothetical protein n=1 Tax=Nocardia transvalensis TaxID=37333 RepID=UPI00189395F2|nr:hypothetical protein [Nocardia transvalensis]MBF6332344.1 hypothetical protein [Nocardia transvalensis]
MADTSNDGIDESSARAGGQPHGPIHPEHGTDGWELRGIAGQDWLVKDYPRCLGRIRPTTPNTCAWTISGMDGRMLREASSRSVDDAKSQADAWVSLFKPACGNEGLDEWIAKMVTAAELAGYTLHPDSDPPHRLLWRRIEDESSDAPVVWVDEPPEHLR